MRAILAFILAPLVPVGGLLALSISQYFIAPDNSIFSFRDSIELVAGYGILFSYAATVVLGLPLFVVCRLLGLVNWYVSLIVPACIGGVIGVLFGRADFVDLIRTTFFAALGALAGLLFWYIYRGPRGKRPERARH